MSHCGNTQSHTCLWLTLQHSQPGCRHSKANLLFPPRNTGAWSLPPAHAKGLGQPQEHGAGEEERTLLEQLPSLSPVSAPQKRCEQAPGFTHPREMQHSIEGGTQSWSQLGHHSGERPEPKERNL